MGNRRDGLVHELVLPTLLFAALGGMTWAVRGCSGFGAFNGCVFAGVTWGAAWWYLASVPSGEQTRRYASAWIVPALTFGIGLSGARGWMQWPSFFEGKLQTDTAHGLFVPIPRAYGFLWLFIAGVPWAGIGACALAWCGSLRETRIWHWVLRIGFGVGTAALARYLFNKYPQHFLPLYDQLAERYRHSNTRADPNLRRLIGDCGAALYHLGFYLGFLFYEIVRRDWKNAVLILTVGVVNGAGWALCQNWKWANALWGSGTFNFWRCWESCGGISIGVAYGLAWFLVNRRMSQREREAVEARRSNELGGAERLAIYLAVALFVAGFLRYQIDGWGNIYMAAVILFGIAFYAINHGPTGGYSDPEFQRWGLSLGLLGGLGLSIRNGLKGWFNIYLGNERYWDGRLWRYFGPAILAGLIAAGTCVLIGSLMGRSRRDASRHAYAWMWLVLLVQNAIAQLITGPHTQWSETAFGIYYLLLFAITAVIVLYFRPAATHDAGGQS
ncbi:MAG TPA: hypothetical protein VK797_16115 [Tepidisphaeraceae bacterium]|nr:hypothetical protein [Tepidisphaeraceae bacterium]